jgi:subtilisin
VSGGKTWPTLEEAGVFLREGRGVGIKIALLDSGVETSHPRLSGLTLADDLAISTGELKPTALPGEGRDVFGHGTAVAGILHEVAPEAQVGSFRVLGENLRSRSLIIHEGVRLALEKGYHILNCSFGCSRDDQVLLYKQWVDQAYICGRHIVAASNNQDFSRCEWPGHFTSVITVSFTRAEESQALWWRRGSLVEFGARGQDIEVAWLGGTTKKVTGSSFAAPHVAGLLARMLSCCPDLLPLHAKALLQKLARPWPQEQKAD